MTHRLADAHDGATREAGPIRVSTAPDLGTRWDAVAFTLLAGIGVIVAAANAPWWSSALVPRSVPVRSVASATASPVATSMPTLPPVEGLSSKWEGQSAYPVIKVGDTATITVTFRNTGTAEWRRGTPSEIRLGIVGDPGFDPSMAVDWPYPQRPAVQSRPVVRPGEVASFVFDVQGTRTGTFRLRLRPIVDGVAWLNDEGVFVDVEVH